MSHIASTTDRRMRVIPVLLAALLVPATSHGQTATLAVSRGGRLERAVIQARSAGRAVPSVAPPTAIPPSAVSSDELLLSDSRNYPDPVRFGYVANAARLPDVGFVLFELDSAALSSGALETLDAICRVANDGPAPFDLTVVGHASDEGEASRPGTAERLRFEQYNYELSVERARVTAEYLRERCMAGERVSYFGLGLQDHVDRLDGPDPRQRRVEIKMRSHDPAWTPPDAHGAFGTE